eukprot:3456996-Prymnesium_polylepis.1
MQAQAKGQKHGFMALHSECSPCTRLARPALGWPPMRVILSHGLEHAVLLWGFRQAVALLSPSLLLASVEPAGRSARGIWLPAVLTIAMYPRAFHFVLREGGADGGAAEAIVVDVLWGHRWPARQAWRRTRRPGAHSPRSRPLPVVSDTVAPAAARALPSGRIGRRNISLLAGAYQAAPVQSSASSPGPRPAAAAMPSR